MPKQAKLSIGDLAKASIGLGRLVGLLTALLESFL